VGDRSYEITTPSGGATTTKIQNYPATSNRIANVTTNGTLTKSFTHDAAGNITLDVKGGDTFTTTYNVRNRPVSVTRSGTASQTSTYAYNALEQMVTRVTTAPGGPAGTVHYIYDTDGHLIAEADGATGATLREYIWLASNDNTPVDLPLGLVTAVNTASPVLSLVHADHLGRPIRMTDATRATVWQAFYTPFGEPYSLSGTIENNLRFPGQFFLIETAQAYNWHRHYDPTTGRYTQPDPLRFVDGPSVYAYVGGSPYMWTDRDGRYSTLPWRPTIPDTMGPLTRPPIPLFPLPDHLDGIEDSYDPPPNPYPSSPQGDNDYYHKVCDQQPPSNLNKCQLAKWKLGKAKLCLDLRKRWRENYGPQPHDNQIPNREGELKNAWDEYLKQCNPLYASCDVNP